MRAAAGGEVGITASLAAAVIAPTLIGVGPEHTGRVWARTLNERLVDMRQCYCDA